MLKKNLPTLIEYNRRLKNLTQGQLAETIGVNISTISRWESGDISSMKADKMPALSEALGIPLKDFFENDYDFKRDNIVERILAYAEAFDDAKRRDLLRYARFLAYEKNLNGSDDHVD